MKIKKILKIKEILQKMLVEKKIFAASLLKLRNYLKSEKIRKNSCWEENDNKSLFKNLKMAKEEK